MQGNVLKLIKSLSCDVCFREDTAKVVLRSLQISGPQARFSCKQVEGHTISGVDIYMVDALLTDHSASRTNWSGGRLLNIHIAPAASFEMQEIAEARGVAGRGIEGDRYFLGTGTYSSTKPDFREVTLFEIEVLEALGRNDPPLQAGPIKLEPAHHRRNLTVRGVPLNHLVGKRFCVGNVILFGGRLNFPCNYLEKLLGLPVRLPLYNRSGLNCRIERDGIIHAGDPIEPVADD